MPIIEFSSNSPELAEYLTHFDGKEIPEGAGVNCGNANYRTFGLTNENNEIVSLCIMIVEEKSVLITGISTSPHHLRKGYATKIIFGLERLFNGYIFGAYAINENSVNLFTRSGFTDIRKDTTKLQNYCTTFGDYVNVIKI